MAKSHKSNKTDVINMSRRKGMSRSSLQIYSTFDNNKNIIVIDAKTKLI